MNKLARPVRDAARRGAAVKEATPPQPLRVLVMSHMDPRVSRGGAEIAAFQMYQEMKARPGIQAWFLAASGGKVGERLGVRIIQPFGGDDYVYVAQGFDHFLHSNPDPEFPPEFMVLLAELRPDVVHLHHYTNFGLETLHLIRRVLPRARIVVTIHEYLAICNHFGQMVKRPSLAMCEAASPRNCHRCFPERSEQDFFMREIFIKRFLRLADAYISPSHFLAGRYRAWGLPAERLFVVENGMDSAEQAEAHAYPPVDQGVVIGFFGQMSRLKGISVLVEAAKLLHKSDSTAVLRIEVHGDDSNQPDEFRKDLAERLSTAPPNLVVRGPYENWRVGQLMQAVHAVIVPSIWWENSPLVIQEALSSRRPVLCSDIGGMAEKVRDGLDGYHFRSGDPRSLASLLRRVAEHPDLLLALQETMARPPSLAETCSKLLAVYQRTASEAPVMETT